MRKISKIVLMITGILVLGFFATGIVCDQISYSTTVTINKPVATVFEKFTDVANYPQWVPNLKSVKINKETPDKVGTVYEKEIDNKGRILKITEEIKTYVKNKEIAYFTDANITLKTDDYLFTEQAGKTTIVKKSVVTSETYIMKCIYPWMKGTFKKMDQLPLDNFKKMIEKQ